MMSPRLFNIFMDKVVRQVNERAMGKRMKLRDENGGSWESSKYYMQMTQFLVAETREHLQNIGREFEKACDSMGLKMNEEKSKFLTIKKD